MNSRFSVLGRIVLALTFVSCSQAGKPLSDAESSLDSEGSAPKIQKSNSFIGDPKYQNTDGTVNYEALRADFGEPNEHVVLNPRATNVANTSSVNSVTEVNGTLTFASKDAAWLKAVKVGDTLYCGAACHTQGQGFVRNVESIRTEGDKIVVSTSAAQITDVIHGGWVSGMETLVFTDQQSADFYLLHNKDYSYTGNGSIPSPAYNWTMSPPFTEPFSGGSISATPSITVQFTYNIAVTGTVLPTISAFGITAVVTPSLKVAASWSGTASASQSWPNIFTASSPSYPFELGPLPCSVGVSITGSGKASESGTIKLSATGTASDTVTGGFNYTGGAFQGVFNNQFSDSYDFDANGTGTASASFTLSTKLTIAYGGVGSISLGSTSIEGDATVGVTATGTANADVSNKGSACSANLTGNFYLTIGGNASATIGIGPISYNPTYPFPSKTWNFPDPAWSKTFTLNDAGTCFQEDAGSNQGGSSSGASGSSGGSSGTNGSSGSGTGSSGSTGASSSSGSVAAYVDGGDTKSYGDCSAGCPSGTFCCANLDGGAAQCVDQSNNDNCGSCGNSCTGFTGDPTSTCSDNVCSCVCPTGTPNEGKTCASLGGLTTETVCGG